MITMTDIQIGIIAAVDKNNLIGYDDKIPWHKPADFKRFKKLTSDSAIIVGTKTWKTIPKLPNRYVIQISRSLEPVTEEERVSMASRCAGFHRVTNIAQAISHAQKMGYKSIWIIGGAEIYQLGFGLANFIDLTRVDVSVEVEDPSKAVYFPTIPDNFQLSETVVNEEDSTLHHDRYINKLWERENAFR